MKAERRAQRAAQLETLHERERLSAELAAAEQTSSQLRRQLDAARAAGAEARAASSALTQRLASTSAQLSTLRSDGAEAGQKLRSAEAALQNTRQQSAALQEANAGLQGKVAGECCRSLKFTFLCETFGPMSGMMGSFRVPLSWVHRSMFVF